MLARSIPGPFLVVALACVDDVAQHARSAVRLGQDAVQVVDATENASSRDSFHVHCMDGSLLVFEAGHSTDDAWGYELKTSRGDRHFGSRQEWIQQVSAAVNERHCRSLEVTAGSSQSFAVVFSTDGTVQQIGEMESID